MGILEEIRDQNAKIIALLEGGAAAAPAKAEAKPKADPKKKEEKPAFTAEQLRDAYLGVQEKHGQAAAKDLITEAGYDKLAALVGDTANWQKSWDLAQAKLAEEPEGDDNGGL